MTKWTTETVLSTYEPVEEILVMRDEDGQLQETLRRVKVEPFLGSLLTWLHANDRGAHAALVREQAAQVGLRAMDKNLAQALLAMFAHSRVGALATMFGLTAAGARELQAAAMTALLGDSSSVDASASSGDGVEQGTDAGEVVLARGKRMVSIAGQQAPAVIGHAMAMLTAEQRMAALIAQPEVAALVEAAEAAWIFADDDARTPAEFAAHAERMKRTLAPWRRAREAWSDGAR